MSLKKIVAFTFALTLFILITAVVAGIDVSANETIFIEVTELNGIPVTASAPVTEIRYGDVFRVTVSMANIQNVQEVRLSMHFNPSVVQVANVVTGEVWPTPPGRNTAFYELGEAVNGTPLRWGGQVDMRMITAPFEPSFNNETGLVRIAFDRNGGANIGARQEFYSVYFKCITPVGGMDAGIRLSRFEDGHFPNGSERDNWFPYRRPNWLAYFDQRLYDQHTNIHGGIGPFYYRPFGIDLNPTPPNPNIIVPDLRVNPDTFGFRRNASNEVELFAGEAISPNATLILARLDSNGRVQEILTSSVAEPPSIKIVNEDDIFRGMAWQGFQNMQPVPGVSAIESRARFIR